MEFALDDVLRELLMLAREVFADHSDPERLSALASQGSAVDPDLWAALAASGLLGVSLPEQVGGGDLGMVALALVLEEQGAHLAQVPLWSAAVAARCIAAGPHELAGAVLPTYVDGGCRIALGLEEAASPDCLLPTTWCEPSVGQATVRSVPATHVVTGAKVLIPAGGDAAVLVLTAMTADGPVVLAVDPEGAGVQATMSRTTSCDTAATVDLDRAPAVQVAGPGPAGVPRLLAEAQTALAACQTGVARGATRLAADYVSSREQFGRPIGTFQAVQHKVADCHIDVSAQRATCWQAAYALDAADTPTDQTLAHAHVAAWWAQRAGLDVVHRVLHLHGGMGVDVDYPAHRYFLRGKENASFFGAQQQSLASLGTLVALGGVSA
ncbi:acyl-CoA dehydrogenase [Branchiibius hedensis]|uniref:Acyl-CoA dehydrogenase n=1 Tax=Branchiibius hedensis TaxID=672460 RepID=A0A2Y8ZUZ8_9MICO|nr:acyl-CoA dehydrogenase family protein [Branchiibius hedensis]PWJ27063.1 acyl-CoA dehydrogenase [Branchiibius hedensis]SSA35874.1 acyl-CoA dehydrogenase [Branchiibius hedensis]